MFLATTALDEFWRKDAEEVLFLGTWCLRYDSPGTWQKLRHKVLPSPWNDRKRFYEAAAYVDGFGERFLPALSRYLNEVHGERHGDRYWRILIGPWLMHAIHAAYDRYVLLSEAAKLGAIDTIGLDRADYQVPATTVDHHVALKGDFYNLQLCTQILEEQGVEVPRQRATSFPPGQIDERRLALKTAVRSVVHGFERYADDHLGKSDGVVLYNLSGPPLAKWRLAAASRFAVIAANPPQFKYSGRPVFDARRTGLRNLPATTEFEKIFVSILHYQLPSIFIEGYRDLTVSAEVPEASAVASMAGWYFDEAVKIRAAKLADRGARVLALQHGGGYGVYRVAPAELHERRISDRFLAWGWADDNADVRNIPAAGVSQIAQRHRPAGRDRRMVLFVPTGHPRYLYRFHSSPVGSQWSEYYEWQSRFFQNLDGKLRRELLYCRLPHEFGHCEKERIARNFPEIRVDATQSAPKRFAQSRIIVIDHCATTLLESLAANLPTILYWDPQRWELRREAAEIFENLRGSRILFDSPEAAAKHLSDVYDDPQRWWQEQSLQSVRRECVQRYARNSRSWPRDWANVMLSELTAPGVESSEVRRAAL